MHLLTFSLTLASFSTSVVAKLDKPIINPEFPEKFFLSVGKGLMANLNATKSSWVTWDSKYGPGWIPEVCKHAAEENHLSAEDVDAFDVQYEDCKDVWSLCRHQNASISEAEMVDVFGRLPVHMRQFVRHVTALPQPGWMGGVTSADNIKLYAGDGGPLALIILAHESCHSLDHHVKDVCKKFEPPFSGSQTWLDAYNADSAVCDGYAQSGQNENFAQEAVVALFDKVVPGGVGSVQPNWKAISHQFSTVQDVYSDTIVVGGSCRLRVKNSPAVHKKDSAEGRPAESTKPDMSFSEDVVEIDASPMGNDPLCTLRLMGDGQYT